MELRLYDTLTKEKRTFVPLDANNVRMYVCGPTVYDFAHIGNARPVIVFDVLFRLLRHLYGEAHVKYVRNITDVDDKINDRAARDFPGLPLNEAIREVTEQTGRQFHADVDALGALRPSVEPRATEHIGEMREIIEMLVAGGFAYVAEDHVLFSPQAMNAANSTPAALRRAVQSLAGRDGRRCPRRCRALQEGQHRLRAVEAVQARRAVVAVAGRHRRAGAPGLAHRVLGHGLEASRRAL
ncbi:cysteinyl-tRNA synthetase [Bradyrhizobium diazoefficiens]